MVADSFQLPETAKVQCPYVRARGAGIGCDRERGAIHLIGKKTATGGRQSKRSRRQLDEYRTFHFLEGTAGGGTTKVK